MSYYEGEQRCKMGAIKEEADETAQLVCQFVKEYFDPPHENEREPWCEAVCAALFSASFLAFMRWSELRESYEAFHETLGAMIESVTRHGANWVNGQLTLQIGGGRVKVDVTERIRARLTGYFSEALHAVCDRGYGIELARSHACFAVLRQWE